MISVLIPTRNAAVRTMMTCQKTLSAADATGHDLEIIIVDDASDKAEREALEGFASPRVRVYSNEKNLGRSGTVNHAAALARGRRLLIVDSDCPPASENFFTFHTSTLDAGADASVGRLLRRKNDFWGRYQDRAVARREAQFARGVTYAFTTQNVLIDAEWFVRIGGFDQGYSQYGFEDRDFFIRLTAAGGRVAYTPDAGVIHDDENIRLPSVVKKMCDAGRLTSTHFAQTHPDAYRVLGYGEIDVRQRPWLRPLAKIAGPLSLSLAPLLERVLDRMPFPIARWFAAATTAIAYLYGTSLASPLANAKSSAPSPKR